MIPFVQDSDFTLWHGDIADVLPALAESSVDAIVTSPPYADARPDVPAPSTAEFVDWFTPTLEELLRVLTPTGGFMLNIGRRFVDGEESDFNEATIRRAREIGWKRIDTLIWHKTNGNARGGPYLHDRHEYAYWLARDTKAYRGYDETRQPYAPSSIPRMQRAPRYAQKGGRRVASRPPNPLGAKPGSVFSSSVGRGTGNEHPTPMDLRFARHLVALSSPPGGTVLDPFLGSATTAFAARELGRCCVGIEREERWCRASAQRMLSVQLSWSAGDAA